MMDGVARLAKKSDYYDMMNTTPDKVVAQTLEERYGQFETESTFKKPYYDNEYPEMEDFYYPSVEFEPVEPPTEGGYPSNAHKECEYCIITCNDSGPNNCDECMPDDENKICKGECHVSTACFQEKEGTPLTDGPLQYTWKIYGPPAFIKYYKDSLGTQEIKKKAGARVEIFPDWSLIDGYPDSSGFKKEAKYDVILIDGLGNICKGKTVIECTGCNDDPIAVSYNGETEKMIIDTEASPPYYIQKRGEEDEEWQTIITTNLKEIGISLLCPCESLYYRASACPVDEEQTDFKTDSCDPNNEGDLDECLQIGAGAGYSFTWYSGNPTTIARNDNVTIIVSSSDIDCYGPFVWGVSGTGFSLEYSKTEGISNTLYADETACGCAFITVTDACGTEVTGTVKCTTGQWLSCDLDCDSGCTGDGAYTKNWDEWLPGLRRYAQCKTSGASNCNYNCDDGRSGSISSSMCDSGIYEYCLQYLQVQYWFC